jgi:hypothetical protein
MLSVTSGNLLRLRNDKRKLVAQTQEPNPFIYLNANDLSPADQEKQMKRAAVCPPADLSFRGGCEGRWLLFSTELQGHQPAPRGCINQFFISVTKYI